MTMTPKFVFYAVLLLYDHFHFIHWAFAGVLFMIGLLVFYQFYQIRRQNFKSYPFIITLAELAYFLSDFGKKLHPDKRRSTAFKSLEKTEGAEPLIPEPGNDEKPALLIKLDRLIDRDLRQIQYGEEKANLFCVARYARDLCMSESNLFLHVRKMTGDNTQTYILNYRLNIAHRWATKNQKPFNIIADELGFSSPGHLTKAFRKVYGCTPNQVRKKKNKILDKNSRWVQK